MKARLHPHDTTPGGLTPEPPQLLREVLKSGLDVKLHLLQHYAELARLLAREILDEEVGCLCGQRYSRDKPLDGRYRRWGSNPGSMTENTEAIKGFLQELIGRGLAFGQGLLCIIDGSKGLFKAVREVFGGFVEVQRCQWHKRENVVSYLAQKDQAPYRRRLQQAYQKVDYPAAKAALMEIHTELEKVNRSASRSLMEGLEETLRLHRLGLFEHLGKSLKTTNCIENLNSQLGKYLGRVKRWMDSDQRQRWVAMGLLEVEQKMRRIDHAEHLPLLRAALLKRIEHQNPSEREPLAEESFN